MKKNGLCYQDYYQDKAGSAFINVKSAVAGKLVNCVVKYKVGKVGIADGGSLKVLFKISSDVPDVQFVDKKSSNYVELISDKPNVKLEGYSRTNGTKGKIYQRPWTNGFTVFVKNGYLTQKDTILIKFKNWRMQTFIEKGFEFKIVVDPFATGKFVELINNPKINVTSGDPKRLAVIAPTTVGRNKQFNF